MQRYTLVVVRHGQSEWNKLNRFTGWVDVALTTSGTQEAIDAGNLLQQKGFMFDCCFCSVQRRAIQTLWKILDVMQDNWIPITKHWRLNERHYGALQGLNKIETVAQHGEEQVKIWRRSYEISPPKIQIEDSHHPKNDRRYHNIPVDQLPTGESLQDVVARVQPYWKQEILPRIQSDKKVLISAHGNSLRALTMLIMGMNPEQIVSYNIPTAEPLVFTIGANGKGIDMQYLNNPQLIRRKQHAVATQTSAKK